MIEIRHLCKQYPGITPLRDVNCTIRDGDVIAVIGPSGCGKSTFLRCINLLETPTGGEILLNGVNIRERSAHVNRHIGMVFQSFHLYPQYTVLENVMMPQIHVLRRSRQAAYDKAVEILRSVNMLSKEQDYPANLSGGQKQRVAIARTLAMDPEAILFDEPTSALDPGMVIEVQSVIRKLAQTARTMLIVTHDMSFAKSVSNRVFYMDEGVLYEEGSPDTIFNHPVREKTREFIFHANEIELVMEDGDHDFLGDLGRIRLFAEQNALNRDITNRILSIYEEVVMIHLASLADLGTVRTVISLSEKESAVRLSVFYGRESFNALQSMQELPLAIIQHHAQELTYVQLKEGGWRNLVRFTVRY